MKKDIAILLLYTIAGWLIASVIIAYRMIYGK
jgi:hypothetical protein